MPVKQQIPLYLGVLVFAFFAYYGIATLILSHPVDKKVNNGQIVIGKTMPTAYFFDVKGEKKTLPDFGGNVVLVNLWATWCTPCVAELPSLNTLQSRLGKKKFKVVAINLDRPTKMGGGLSRNFLAERGWKNIHPYWDRERQIPERWPYEGLPTSYLLDKKGTVQEIYKGPVEWDKPEIADRIVKMVQ